MIVKHPELNVYNKVNSAFTFRSNSEKTAMKSTQKTASSTELFLYGGIGAKDNSTADFISQFKNAESKFSQINLRINSTGGDVFDGITIYNTIKNSTSDVYIYVDGLAASMASVIALAGKKIYMSRYAQLMLHKVSGNVNGDAEKLRETASLMDEVEKSIAEIYASRTGLTVEDVNNKFLQRGKDSWFNAKQALQNNLADEIFDGVVSKPNIKSDTEELWSFYQLQISNTLNNNTMELKTTIISQLGLQESATDTEIFNSISAQTKVIADLKSENQNLTEQVTKLQGEMKISHAQKIKEMLDNAIRTNRITEDQRTSYNTLAEANYEAVHNVLNKMTPYKSITAQLATEDEPVEFKTFQEYSEKAPEMLADMKANNPTKYISLYKKQFGKEPKLTIN